MENGIVETIENNKYLGIYKYLYIPRNLGYIQGKFATPQFENHYFFRQRAKGGVEKQ